MPACGANGFVFTEIALNENLCFAHDLIAKPPTL
jgi:hypothetical protein